MAVPTSNPASMWTLPVDTKPPFTVAPPGNQDTQFRRLTTHVGNPYENPTTNEIGLWAWTLSVSSTRTSCPDSIH